MGRKIGVGPSWYNSSWLQRYPVMVDAVTGTSSGTVDVTFAIPADWDHFWSNVQDTTNGYDIIVTGPDGRTLLSFDLSGFSYANRTCTVRIDGLVLEGTGKAEVVWLYWNKTSPSNAAAAVTITSALTGYIARGEPPTGYTVKAAPLAYGETQSRATAWKDPSDQSVIWWDVTDALVARPDNEPHNGKTGLEGISYVTPSMDPGGTASVTGTKTRYVLCRDRLYVAVFYTGGATNSQEEAILEIVTKPSVSTGVARTLRYTALLSVENGL